MEVEALMSSDHPLYRESWHQIKGLYRAAVDRAMPPAQVTLERKTVERVEMYSYVPPPGENISIFVELFLVDNSVPTEVKIEWSVKRLRNHRSRVPSGRRAEHLKR